MSADNRAPDERPIIETLIARDRIRGDNRMFLEGKDAASVTDDDWKQVAHEVRLYMKARHLNNNDVARAIGHSPTTISELLNCKYKGEWREKLLDLDRWLDQQLKADKAPATTQFVWTEVAREIQTVANLVVQLRKIGLVYGPDTSGIGKTQALRALNLEIPGSVLITCTKVEASAYGLLRSIARGLRISDRGRNTTLYQQIKAKLCNTPRLLMIDQIHNLRAAKDDRPLYVLADLYDETNAPQLWCGTADMVAYLRRGQSKGDESLAQIRRRITYVRDLMQRTRDARDGGRGEPLVTIDQIREMFAKNKIRLTRDGEKFLWSLCQIPDSGAVGTCANLVLIATIIAEERSLPSIDAKLLKAALRDSVQGDTFRELQMAQIDEEPNEAAG
jgi:DNA transposition AAA+ family ATPase